MAESQEDEIIEQNESLVSASFDQIMGYIQDIILSEEFVCIRDMFFEDHCQIFEDVDENKLEYTAIFEKYVDLVEGYLESELREKNENFDMTVFLKELEEESKTHCLQGDIVELLSTFSDFSSFKMAMLDAKKATILLSNPQSKSSLNRRLIKCHQRLLEKLKTFCRLRHFSGDCSPKTISSGA